MNHLSQFGSLVIISATMPLAIAADESLRTEWGHPDLQGVWNFSTEIPFERPAQFGSREFLSADEIREIQQRLAADAAAGAVVEADAEFANRGAPDTSSRQPGWRMVALVYPFAAAAVAINLFLLFLMLQAVGLPAMSPGVALALSGPLGVPAAWAAARWIRGLIAEAEGR